VSGSRLPSISASEPQVWIFAYGSLMWRPGFAHEPALDAWLHGYHRALCVYSWVHRGTQERPGLVLGLDRGGSCRGRALGIARESEAEVLAYLDERELVTEVYQRRRLPVMTAHGRVPAWCYVVRQDHAQYAGKLDDDRLLELVRHGAGRSGRCCDYVISTVSHLEEMGVADGPLHALARRLVT
jgi:glutathione-specific gamma-glutamylcyclotransferase